MVKFPQPQVEGNFFALPMNILHIGVYAIILKNRSLCLVEKARGPFTGLWDLPGGKIEGYETVTEALEREILEETGIQVLDYSLYSTLNNKVTFKDERGSISMYHMGIMYSITHYKEAVEMIQPYDDVVESKWFLLEETPVQVTPFAAQIIKELKETP
jgi:8-oxo-dGTP diphosphatase